MRHVPNVLTILRLLVTPIVVWLILAGDFNSAVVLFAAAGLTDAADGMLARRFGWSSRLGALLDPVADKALLASVFLTLAWVGEIPAWLAGVVLARDIGILAAAIYLKTTRKMKEFSPSVFGKLSTLAQLLTAGAVLLRWPPEPAPLFFVTAALAVVSAGHYGYQIRQNLN